VIKFVSDLRQIGGFLRKLRFPLGDGKVAKIIGFGMAKQLDQDVLKMGLY
jgi:hypothetical protein